MSLPSAANFDPRAFYAVRIRSRSELLEGELGMPPGARGVVVLVREKGTGRFEERAWWIAAELQWEGFATLLVDLTRRGDAAPERVRGQNRMDVQALARRLTDVVDWLEREPETRRLPVGIIGSSSGAVAALVVATRRPARVRAVVSCGGRPDRAERSLPAVKAPTLFVVGGNDPDGLVLVGPVAGQMTCDFGVEVVPAASPTFAEPEVLESATALAREWFLTHLHGAVFEAGPDRMPCGR